MRRKLRILFAAFEAEPFMKTGGLGDVGGTLPRALKNAGCEVRVIMPKFDRIPQQYKDKMKHVADFTVNLGWRSQYCGIEQLKHNDVIYYFVDNEYYFKRDMAYGYFDDGERIAFFSRAVAESIQHIPDFKCDVLHLNDWHAALSAVYVRELYKGNPVYDNVKTVFTVHNLKFQGQYSRDILGDVLGLQDIPAARDQLSFEDGVNFMKGALLYSDVLTTVSPTYAQEIKTAFFGEKMENIFKDRESILYGILNGIDPDMYDPEKDGLLPARFDISDMSGKKECKAALQRELGLNEEPDTPLIVMIGRLTEQKGMDLLAGVIDDIMEKNLQIAVLGTGDKQYEELLRNCEKRYAGKIAAKITFDSDLSHRMYAGADMLLMPSLFEPCGLSQMIAMRYGTLPVVRETGGLNDSVEAYNKYTGEGTGFSFRNYNAHEMMYTIHGAADLYASDKNAWHALMENAMSADFSWSRAAEQYVGVYKMLHPDITPWERATKK